MKVVEVSLQEPWRLLLGVEAWSHKGSIRVAEVAGCTTLERVPGSRSLESQGLHKDSRGSWFSQGHDYP